jgi:NADH:ubiquinone oxidoreductase subunit E
MKPQSPTDNRPEVMAAAKEELPEEIVKFIEECCWKEHSESQLISVLHKVQAHFGYLAPEKLDAVAQLLQVPAATVSGVATFYHFFRLSQRGRFVVSVCMGTACYVKGAQEVVEKFREELGITFGETTADGMFTLEESRCVGTCGLAPVVMVNERVHGKVTTEQVPVLIEDYRNRPSE